MIDVEHGPLRSFEHDALAVAHPLAEKNGTVRDASREHFTVVGVVVVELSRIEWSNQRN